MAQPSEDLGFWEHGFEEASDEVQQGEVAVMVSVYGESVWKDEHVDELFETRMRFQLEGAKAAPFVLYISRSVNDMAHEAVIPATDERDAAEATSTHLTQ